MGLDFAGFAARANGASSLKAISPNNTASSLPLQTQSISSNYTSSPVKTFDLVASYVGCAVLTGASVGLPQKCTVQFKGYRPDGTIFSETCTYAGTVANPTLKNCSLKTLQGVIYIVVAVTDSQTAPATTVFFLDNTEVTKYFY